LNVVDPSPTPNVVDTTENSDEYVVRETAVPSHSNQPFGAEEPANACTDPAGTAGTAVTNAPPTCDISQIP